MNADINNKIMDLMKDLVRFRNVPTQNFNVYLAKMSTEDKKSSKLPIKSGPLRPQIISERSEPNSTAEVRDSSHRYSLRRRISKIPADPTIRHGTRAGIMSTSKLPTTLRSSPNASITYPPKISMTRSKEITANIKAQSANLKLTSEERESLISTILSNELELRSKLDAQAKELLSDSPKLDNIQSHKTPVPSDRPNRLRPNSIRNGRLRPSKYGTRTSLTPIPEASEVDAWEVETIEARENLRQQQMESEVPDELIQDIDAGLLRQSSDESDSLDELVVKDFAIRVVQSEPDAAINSLPITEQAIIESNKLRDAIDSVKERFQVKVARVKYAEQKQKVQVPNTQTVRASIPSTPGKIKQSVRSPATRTTPTDLIDSENWGDAALQKPIFDRVKPVDELSTSEEDFLTEKDMQFDDHFGVDNVSQPTSIRKTPQRKLQKNDETSSRIHQQAKILVDSYVQNIEDLESPQFSDFPSDDSAQITQVNFNVSENKEINFGGHSFPTNTPSHRMANKSASEQSTNVVQKPDEIETVHESQHEKDIKKIKELLDSGAMTSSIANERFEEGVLDLLLRQSDSLWNPIVVGGIPISYIIPTQNYERSILDTSINERNLDSPLIKKPEKKLPGYIEALENEWATYIKKKNESPKVNNNNSQNNDELVQGLPKFSYEPAPQYLYRKKVHNIMDSEDESEDSLNILADDEMSLDDFTSNIAEPAYDFKLGKIFDDLEIKMKILHRLKNDKATTKMSVASKGLDSKPMSPVEMFHQNKQQLNALFGIVQTTTPNGDNYIPSNEIESLCKKIPLIEGRIVRNVENCRYHLELMKSTFNIIIKYMSQTEQPTSSQSYDNFYEIIKTFNKIKDGRICARLQFCPTTNSHPLERAEKKDESPTKQINQASQTSQASGIQSEHQQPVQNPVKIRKSVSFVNSIEEDESSKTKEEKAPGSVSDKKSEKVSKSQKNVGDDVNRWKTLDISEVKDLIEYARKCQARHKDSNQQKVKNSRLR